MIVIMAGLPGTGKSAVARSLALRLSGAVLDKDIVRAALFAPEHVEYSVMQDDFCQEILLQTAGYLLRKNLSLYIFLDGRTFSRRYQRERVFEFCSQLGTRWAILECICSEHIVLERLKKAAESQTHPAMNRTPDLYNQIRKTWEPIDYPKLVIDTEASLDSCIERAMEYLAQIARQPG
jgi:predicted kinase